MESQLVRELIHTRAREGADVPAHLANYMKLWNRITSIFHNSYNEDSDDDDEIPFMPCMYKKLLLYLLPPSYDNFARPYIRDKDRRKMSVHDIIGECNEEYHHRKDHAAEEAEQPTAYSSLLKPSLASQITGQPQKANTSKCIHCGRENHKSEDCYHFLEKPHCSNCNRIGHEKEEACQNKKKTQKPHRDKGKMVADATSTKNQANVAQNKVHIVHTDTDEEVLMVVNNNEELNLEDPYMHFASDINEDLSRMYLWLADSSATHHITSQRDLFSTYKYTPGATVHGVGGKIIQVQGCGTVKLIAQNGMRKRTLILDKVNHIPTNKYNILAFGRWTTQGRRYEATSDGITLYNRHDEPVVHRQRSATQLCIFQLIPYD